MLKVKSKISNLNALFSGLHTCFNIEKDVYLIFEQKNTNEQKQNFRHPQILYQFTIRTSKADELPAKSTCTQSQATPFGLV